MRDFAVKLNKGFTNGFDIALECPLKALNHLRSGNRFIKRNTGALQGKIPLINDLKTKTFK